MTGRAMPCGRPPRCGDEPRGAKRRPGESNQPDRPLLNPTRRRSEMRDRILAVRDPPLYPPLTPCRLSWPSPAEFYDRNFTARDDERALQRPRGRAALAGDLGGAEHFPYPQRRSAAE